ncbi:uncharacterized protein LOC131025665 [Salvia miltiorrhiza]|uniref:uncharacterized protein LOC131025665 n=1 Tax=Salvia miltiorrhiza TaxID=226208 RepID=UPI0025AD14A4|nr:uncharacterized protein LOC131025665 [Salvia miltiorrhiza]
MASPGLLAGQDRPQTPKISSNFDPPNSGKAAVPLGYDKDTPTKVLPGRVSPARGEDTRTVTSGTHANPIQAAGNNTLNPVAKSYAEVSSVEEFQFALIGRILLRKGDKPRPYGDIKKELQELWNIQGPWNLIPMGKGYYTCKFSIADDKSRAKKQLLWELPTGSIRLREWAKVFDPYKEVSSLCHTWVHIYYLPVECWHPEVIIGISRHIGLPIKIDNASVEGQFGHFARILLEIDLALPLQESLLVNCDEGSFYVEFVYEQLPHYCTRCKITGHSIDKCKKAEQRDSKARNVNKENQQPQSKEKTAAVPSNNQENWKVKEAEVVTNDKEKDGNLSTDMNIVEHQNVFEALEGIVEDINEEEEGLEEECYIMDGTDAAVEDGKGVEDFEEERDIMGDTGAGKGKGP